MKISIITPSFNQGRFIERTIESILGQRGDFELEYLVLDGGSTDETLEILRTYDGRIRWSSARDHGQIDAINRGFRLATGDIVGWVNSDDLLRPGALARVKDAFDRDHNLQWLHGRCDIIDEHDRVIRHVVSAYKHWCAARYSYSRLLRENFISQMTVFWRRSLFDGVGLLDPRFPLAFDYELWLRFGKVSDPLYLPDRLACFRWYDTSKSGANYERQFDENYLAAQHHAPTRRWTLFVKRLRAACFVTGYKLLAFRRTAL
ncbi:MAG: glycosyltransferase family 2 protein [Nitrospirota bacterium]